MISRRLLVVVVAALACSNSQPESDAKPASPEDALAVLREGAITLIGQPTCSATGECRTIAFGAKPCGGPRSYLPYSLAVTDSITLADAVRKFNERDAEHNREFGLMSDCSVVPEPTVACVDGLCVTGG